MYVIVYKKEDTYFYSFDPECICFHSSVSRAVCFDTLSSAQLMIDALDLICEGISDSVYIKFVEV